MQLTPEQVEGFDRDGFLLIENLFSQDELDLLSSEIRAEFAGDSPRHIRERSGAVRSVFAVHFTNEVFRCLMKLPRLLEPARQLLGSDVYVHQYKLNAKVALDGDKWEWHQDFLYWHKEDGMPEPRVLTAALFIQEVNDYNGPMLLIPGSHREGMIDLGVTEARENGGAQSNGGSQDWIHTLTADLKYKIDREILAGLLRRNRICAGKGPAGLVLFFQGNLFHASADNLSAEDRNSVFISYNSVENKLREVERPRPTFIASRDFRAVAPTSDDALLMMCKSRRIEYQERVQQVGELA
jgi:ectoine hydroxylase